MKSNTIIISPYSRTLSNGKQSPKNYPYFKEVAKGLQAVGFNIIQIGIMGEKSLGIGDFLCGLPLKKLEKMKEECLIWIGVDNFFVHLGNKPGIVIYGPSDPLIFGYTYNTNLLKDRKYLRKLQFDIWEAEVYDSERFVEPSVVINAVLDNIK